MEIGQLVTKDFGLYLNDQFKVDSNIFITTLDTFTDKTKVVAVKKEDFLYVGGFDEQSSAEACHAGLISRLETYRVKKVKQDPGTFKPKWATEKPVFDHVYLNLDKILVQHINPYTSKVIFMYDTGLFEMGVLINNVRKKSEDFGSSYKKRKISSKYALTKPGWVSGTWNFPGYGDSIVLITEKDEQFSLYPKERSFETCLNNQTISFLKVNSLGEKKELIDFHYQTKNPQFSKNNNKVIETYVNDLGFGRGIVYKNFDIDFQSIIN